MIAGKATPEATASYHQAIAQPEWGISNVGGLILASIGVGTYRGDMSPGTDEMQEEALYRLFSLGCNVVDTAPNYRGGHSEKCVGLALSRAIRDRVCERDAIFIATKAGLVPEGVQLSPNFSMGPEYSCFDPDYLENSLAASLERLNLQTVDCVFLHNLELLKLADPANFEHNYSMVARRMELMVESGMAASWGISSWNGFRVPPEHPEYLNVKILLTHAGNNLKYLQLPLGLWGSEAITARWQEGQSILQNNHGLHIFANSPLLQGELERVFADSPQMIEKAVCFTRDAPNVSVVLLGMKSPAHIKAWERMRLITPDMEEIIKLFQ